MKNFKFLIFILNIILSMEVYASISNDIKLNKLNFCQITTSAENNYEPEIFETTNNLLRETGQEALYCGEKIIISGRVVDQNCVPVSDAKVYIWQVDCKGKYPYKPLRNLVDEKLINENRVLSFTGNGVATTNNKGEFHFVTVYPPAVHGYPSHVNIRVEHMKLGELQTILKLKEHKVKNPENYPGLASIYNSAAKSNISIYDYQIVIKGNGEDNY